MRNPTKADGRQGRTRTLAVFLLLLGSPLGAEAGLEGDTILIERHWPTLGQLYDDGSFEVVVEPGDQDRVSFDPYHVKTIDVDPESILLMLGCDASGCSFAPTDFNGFVLSGLDWSAPPGPPIALEIETSFRFFDVARIELLPGEIQINLSGARWSDGDFIRILPVYAPRVEIDILPRSSQNVIGPQQSRRRLPVAILGSLENDVTKVDPFSLRFGPGEATAALSFWSRLFYRFTLEDLNNDGYDDLRFRFDLREAAIPDTATEACLSGDIDGEPFLACDAVSVRTHSR